MPLVFTIGRGCPQLSCRCGTLGIPFGQPAMEKTRALALPGLFQVCLLVAGFLPSFGGVTAGAGACAPGCAGCVLGQRAASGCRVSSACRAVLPGRRTWPWTPRVARRNWVRFRYVQAVSALSSRDTRLSSRLATYHNNGRSQQVPCPGAPRTGPGLEHCARPGSVRTEGGGARLGSVRKAARRGAAAGPGNRRGSAGLGARARRAGGPRDCLGRAAGSSWMRWFVHWRSIRDPVGRHTFPVAHVRFLLDGSGRGA